MLSLGLVFWLIMLLLLIFSLLNSWPNHYLIGMNLISFVLFGLLGWKVFGPPIHGG